MAWSRRPFALPSHPAPRAHFSTGTRITKLDTKEEARHFDVTSRAKFRRNTRAGR